MENTLFQMMAGMTMDAVFAIARNKGITVNKSEVVAKCEATYRERFKAIYDEMVKDGKDADFLGQIDRGRVPALSLHTAKISLAHGCTMYAKELLNVTE